MQLQWRTHVDLSAMHAAWCTCRFADRVGGCSQAMLAAAQEFSQVPARLNASDEVFWDSALTLCIDCQANQELAKRMLIRLVGATGCPPAHASELAMRVAAVERAFGGDFPNYNREIVLRTEPLKQLWEAHGPGLLHSIGNLTDPELLVESAEIYLVQPIVGGLGYAHLATNRVHLEALLTNVDPHLPETVRLAWLLSQLDLERPVHSEQVSTRNLRHLAGLAMIPPILLAASELELCPGNSLAVERAIELWHVDLYGASAQTVADVLMAWWETYQAARPAWPTALAGLGRMLDQDQL